MTGKTVTLDMGVVVTDIGPTQVVVRGGEEITDERVRTVRGDDGIIRNVLRSVIEALPETIRRDSFDYRP